jgi:hypothetical protein
MKIIEKISSLTKVQLPVTIKETVGKSVFGHEKHSNFRINLVIKISIFKVLIRILMLEIKSDGDE